MTDQPTFTGVHFWVADMAASVAFYRLAGFDVPAGAEDGWFTRVSLPGSQTFEFGTDALTLRYDPGFEPPPRAMSANCLQFTLTSREAVDALHTQLTAAGYRSHLAPIDAFWGSRYAEVLDPDGNACGFHSPSDPAHRVPGP